MSTPAPSNPCLPCGDCPLTQTPAACAPPGTQRGFCLEATCGINLSFSATATRNPLTLKIKRELCNLTLKSCCLPSFIFYFYFLRTTPPSPSLSFFVLSQKQQNELRLSTPKPDPLFPTRQIADTHLVLLSDFSGDNLQKIAFRYNTHLPCTRDQYFK